MIRAASLENSERLQRVHALLRRGGEYSTRDVVRQAHVCAVNSAIAELRANGVSVETRRDGRVYYYSLPARGQMELGL